MPVRIFAIFDESGLPKGFYPTDVWPNTPAGAVEISHDDWLEFLDYQGQRRWDGKQVVEYSAPPVSAPVAEATTEILALVEETKLMNEAIVAAVRAWGGIENALAYLLGTIIRNGGGSLGMALYYRPSATETRISLVDESVKHFCQTHKEGGRVLALWDTILNRINHCKTTRNKIIHGNVGTYCPVGAKQHVRLTAPIFNLGTNNKDLERLRKNTASKINRDAAPQLPGMSANDVKNAAINFGRLTEAANLFRLLVSEMQRNAQKPEAFDKKFQTLDSHLKTPSLPRTGDQIPEERPDQPQSSRA